MADSSPFNVKFARVGLIIPPCGVPLSVVSVNSPLIYPAFSHAASIGFKVTSKGILSINH